MNPIREYFKKNPKFKDVGPGRRLGSSTSSSESEASASKTQSKKSLNSYSPSEVSKKAAEAAISRLEQKPKNEVNWSLVALRTQAKKELELELQAAEKENQTPKPVQQESSMLSVNGVFFHCPFVGPYVLSYTEIQDKIKEFLYSQLEEEPGLTSCLILISCNDMRKTRTGIDTLTKYLKNILDNPSAEKYRKIRINNKVFQERVAYLEGAFDFLMACGFVLKKLKTDGKDEEEEYLMFPEEASMDYLCLMKDALDSVEPIRPELDRNIRVLRPSQVEDKVELPPDFFNLSSEELMKEQESRSQDVELNQQLRTKAMRERDEIKEHRIYKYSRVRIKFPDGIILEGTFSVRESLRSVKDYVVDNLANETREYFLLAPGGVKLIVDESTLLELNLVPAVLLVLKWVNADLQASFASLELSSLKPETMALLQTV